MADGEEVLAIIQLGSFSTIVAILALISREIFSVSKIDGSGEMASAQESVFQGTLVALELADIANSLKILVPAMIFVFSLVGITYLIRAR